MIPSQIQPTVSPPRAAAGRRGRPTCRWCAVLAAAAATLLAACVSTAPENIQEQPAEILYNRAMDSLTAGEGNAAVGLFNEVERQHPYSIWASKAMLMASYTYYGMNRYNEAIAGLDRFIRLHPGSRDYAYAFYLKSLCYYEQIADVRRDQGITRQAMEALQEVMQRFPRTKYARDAKLKYDLTRDQLAGQEMAVGRWYQQRGHFISAINRFQTVIKDYETTSHVPEALHRLTESFLALGLKDEAQKAAAVLGHNFPGSEWYLDSYALMTGIRPEPEEQVSIPRRGSWWSRTWDSIF